MMLLYLSNVFRSVNDGPSAALGRLADGQERIWLAQNVFFVQTSATDIKSERNQEELNSCRVPRLIYSLLYLTPIFKSDISSAVTIKTPLYRRRGCL